MSTLRWSGANADTVKRQLIRVSPKPLAPPVNEYRSQGLFATNAVRMACAASTRAGTG